MRDAHATLGDVLKRYLRTSPVAAALRNKDVAAAWQQAVGPQLAAQTRIVGFNCGTLKVETASGSLYSELNAFRKHELLQLLQERMGNRKVQKISFCLGQTAERDGDESERIQC